MNDKVGPCISFIGFILMIGSVLCLFYYPTKIVGITLFSLSTLISVFGFVLWCSPYFNNYCNNKVSPTLSNMNDIKISDDLIGEELIVIENK
jgi:hypothetical protein